MGPGPGEGSCTVAVNPTAESIEEIVGVAGTPEDGPIVMINLNRFRERADYGPNPPEGLDVEVSGEEAYARYGAVGAAAVAATGGRLLWSAPVASVVIGDPDDSYHQVLAVWYPSRAAFLKLGDHPGYLDATIHRNAALEKASILCCPAGDPESLGNPG